MSLRNLVEAAIVRTGAMLDRALLLVPRRTVREGLTNVARAYAVGAYMPHRNMYGTFLDLRQGPSKRCLWRAALRMREASRWRS